MKRSCSESDDIMDDDFAEEMCSVVTGSSEHHTGPRSTRKRRRGVIEKRRRDRINHSLNELKRLVPTALEKSGSAKLEKAEILQMTVDHLKVLQTKGIGSTDLGYDHHRIAMDYHGIGFRECAAEIARYLVSVEGMDFHDPMRIRIMSHLQMFAARTAQQPNPATTPTAVPPPPPPPPPPAPAPPAAPTAWSSYTSCYVDSSMNISSTDPFMMHHPQHNVSPIVPSHHGYYNQQRQHVPSTSPSTTTSSTSSSSSSSTTTPSSSSNNYSAATTTSSEFNGSYAFSHHYTYSNPHHQQQQPVNSKQPQNQPYRPWGAEMAC